MGGFPSIHHNQIQDVTAQLLSEVCTNVEVEVPLQPLTTDILPHRTVNVEVNVLRLDVKVQGFWRSDRQCSYFYGRVFNPQTPTNRTQSIAVSYRRHEKEKRRVYKKRVVKVEHQSFIPILLSSVRGWGLVQPAGPSY